MVIWITPTAVGIAHWPCNGMASMCLTPKAKQHIDHRAQAERSCAVPSCASHRDGDRASPRRLCVQRTPISRVRANERGERMRQTPAPRAAALQAPPDRSPRADARAPVRKRVTISPKGAAATPSTPRGAGDKLRCSMTAFGRALTLSTSSQEKLSMSTSGDAPAAGRPCVLCLPAPAGPHGQQVDNDNFSP